MTTRRRALLGIALVVLLIAGSRVLGVTAWLQALPSAAEQAGPAGVVSFMGVYAVATALALPVSVLTLGAGLVWGPLKGFAVVWPGAVVGACLAFLLGRTVARGPAERLARRDPRFDAVDQAIASQGWLLVLLLRLSPVFPFNALNYGLGVTRIGLLPYATATAVGIVPGTFLYAYLGSIGQAATGEATTAQRALFVIGLVATLVVTVVVTRLARAALGRRVDLQPSVPHPSEPP